MRSDVSKINENTPYEELTEGLTMFAGGTAKDFRTGPWRTMTPVFIKERCKQCLLCAPVCPDGCIPVADSRRADFDYDHCKGCGICGKACPFNAIEMIPGTDANPLRKE
ncbi:MAG: 4Fe-4S binding protein [Lachnospiraceae bacterium]|nr:4Fe-4S binding protein [Lachnospiraceae bacterium]